MTHDKVMAMVAEMNVPSAYHHFAEGESPAPPFLIYFYPGTVNFAADGRVYFSQNRLHIELYTEKKDPCLEEQIEAILNAHELFYNKTEVWIASERLYEILYELEV